MSSLIVSIRNNEVLVATDTLAVSNPIGLAGRKNAAAFTTKAFYIPHLRLLIAGTGMGGFLDKWLVALNKVPLRDIEDLNDMAPVALCDLCRLYQEGTVGHHLSTSSIYQFGYSEKTRLLHAYSYHSGDDFQSKPITSPTFMKPRCEELQSYELPTDLKILMESQRRLQTWEPQERRVYIGGEIIVYRLSYEGCRIHTLDRFDDYEDTAKQIFGEPRS